MGVTGSVGVWRDTLGGAALKRPGFMRKIYARHMFGQTLAALALVLVALTAVLWIAMALRSLNLVTGQGQTTATFIKITLLALPNLLSVIVPVALMIAMVQTLNRANGDSELIVMTASGATAWELARPFLLLALIVSIAVALANLVVNPWSARALYSEVTRVRTDLITQVLKPGEFISPQSGITIHLRKRTQSGDLLGLIIRDTREENRRVTYLAERARIVKAGGAPYLVMRSGYVLQQEKLGRAPRVVVFDSYAFDLNTMADQAAKTKIRPRARSMAQLWNPDPEDPYFKARPGKLRAELHERLAGVLYPFAFALIVLAMLGRARTTREGRNWQIVVAVAVALILRVTGLGLTNLVANRAWAVPLVYALPLGAIGLAVFNIQSTMWKTRSHRFASGVFDAKSGLVSALGRLFRGTRPNMPHRQST